MEKIKITFLSSAAFKVKIANDPQLRTLAKAGKRAGQKAQEELIAKGIPYLTTNKRGEIIETTGTQVRIIHIGKITSSQKLVFKRLA